jgi:hypothetical protein
VALELTGEVGLIVEPDASGDQGDGLAVEQAPAGGVDAAGRHVLVWRDPEPAGEAADEMGR